MKRDVLYLVKGLVDDMILSTQYYCALAGGGIKILDSLDDDHYKTGAISVKIWKVEVHSDGPSLHVQVVKSRSLKPEHKKVVFI